MSMVTSCPQCGTTFRVTQEQLSASQGNVRCGKCQHVFDALTRLAEIPAAPATQPVTQSPASSIPPPPPRLFADTASRDKLGSPRGGFRLPRWLLVLLAVLLFGGAVLQALYYLRTPIAAQWPVLRPHFVALCDRLQCTIGLPQHAELLAIDDSDMQEDAEREGVIHLSATLINNASYSQAFPLLELTLTDAYDKPVIRRALTPSEYLPGKETVEGILPGEAVQIAIALMAADAEVAGYRLFVRYPGPNENH